MGQLCKPSTMGGHRVSHGGGGESGGRGSGGYFTMNSLRLGGSRLRLSRLGAALCCHYLLFRWFKFTLKPPYSGASERSLLAIWDTSHWNFFVKFGLKTA